MLLSRIVRSLFDSIESEWMSAGSMQQMEGSGNAVTEQFLPTICLSSQRTPVQQHDTQVKLFVNLLV